MKLMKSFWKILYLAILVKFSVQVDYQRILEESMEATPYKIYDYKYQLLSLF